MNCKDHHKLFYKIQITKCIVDTNESISKALTDPIFGPIQASIIAKLGEEKIKKFQDEYIKGPICGSHLIENGKIRQDIIL